MSLLLVVCRASLAKVTLVSPCQCRWTTATHAQVVPSPTCRGLGMDFVTTKMGTTLQYAGGMEAIAAALPVESESTRPNCHMSAGPMVCSFARIPMQPTIVALRLVWTTIAITTLSKATRARILNLNSIVTARIAEDVHASRRVLGTHVTTGTKTTSDTPVRAWKTTLDATATAAIVSLRPTNARPHVTASTVMNG